MIRLDENTPNDPEPMLLLLEEIDYNSYLVDLIRYSLMLSSSTQVSYQVTHYVYGAERYGNPLFQDGTTIDVDFIADRGFRSDISLLDPFYSEGIYRVYSDMLETQLYVPFNKYFILPTVIDSLEGVSVYDFVFTGYDLELTRDTMTISRSYTDSQIEFLEEFEYNDHLHIDMSSITGVEYSTSSTVRTSSTPIVIPIALDSWIAGLMILQIVVKWLARSRIR